VPKENIVWLGFPDCRLNYYRGRRPAGPEDAVAISDFTGMQNAFTYYLREIKPTQCFLPTSNDFRLYHPASYRNLFEDKTALGMLMT